MLKFFNLLMLIIFSSVIMMGCAATAVSPVTGFLYTDVKAPVSVTANEGSSKVGTAHC